MQVAKALVYALEKKFRVWQLPQLTLPDLPLVYLLKSNVQSKSCQLHSQYKHSTWEPLISVGFCQKEHFSYELWHLWLTSICQRPSLFCCSLYSLAFASLLRFRILKYQSDMRSVVPWYSSVLNISGWWYRLSIFDKQCHSDVSTNECFGKHSLNDPGNNL